MQLTFEFEGEMFGEMTTLVVAPQHEEGRRKVDLEREQIQNALHTTAPSYSTS